MEKESSKWRNNVFFKKKKKKSILFCYSDWVKATYRFLKICS
jgi:hypothetical protein